jgi:hypothetical protein
MKMKGDKEGRKGHLSVATQVGSRFCSYLYNVLDMGAIFVNSFLCRCSEVSSQAAAKIAWIYLHTFAVFYTLTSQGNNLVNSRLNF